MLRTTFATLAVIGAVLTAPSSMSAQEAAPAAPAAPRPSVGAFWSANFATVSLSPAIDGVEGRQWVGGGLTLGVPLGGGLSLDVRAYWNRRGARLPVAGTSGFQDVSADYVTLPVLFKAATRGAVRPYVIAGAEISLRTRARVRTVVGVVDADEDASSLVRRTDAALDGGAGVERTLGKATLFVEGLYSHGLRNVTPEPEGDTTRTRTLTLLAGIRF